MTPTGVKLMRKKIDVVLKMGAPATQTEVRSFIGAVTFYLSMWPRRSCVAITYIWLSLNCCCSQLYLCCISYSYCYYMLLVVVPLIKSSFSVYVVTISAEPSNLPAVCEPLTSTVHDSVIPFVSAAILLLAVFGVVCHVMSCHVMFDLISLVKSLPSLSFIFF